MAHIPSSIFSGLGFFSQVPSPVTFTSPPLVHSNPSVMPIPLNHENHSPPKSFSLPYAILSASKIQINRINSSGKPIDDPISLPASVSDIRPIEFKYNFKLELETISQIDEERKREDMLRLEEEKKRREKALQAQAEAWKALQEKRNRTRGNTPPKLEKYQDPSTLVDLNFDIDEMQQSPPSTHRSSTQNISTSSSTSVSSNSSITNKTTGFVDSRSTTQPPKDGFQLRGSMNRTPEQQYAFLANPKSEKLFLKLIDIGLNSEVVKIAIELFGPDNEFKVIEFTADFQRLQEFPDKFPFTRIKQALVLYDGDFDKAWAFLKEWDKLSKIGIQDEQILDTLSMFNNNIITTSQFLQSFKTLKDFQLEGVGDVKIKEALVMSNNDIQKAVQYILDHPGD